MSLIVNLPPDVETRLEEAAARQGISAADVALRFIERGVASALKPNPNDLPYDEWKKRYDKFVNQPIDPNAPYITPEMTRRANLYNADDEEVESDG